MKQLHKNISFTGASKLFTTALAFILVPVATRSLGPDHFGIYTLATTIGFFVTLLADFGVSTLVTREISKHQNIASHLFSRALVLKVLLAIFAIILLSIYFILSSYSDLELKTILIFILSSLLGTFTLVAYSVFRGFQFMQYEALGESLDKFISVSIGIVLLLLGFGVRTFVISFVIAAVVKFVLSFRLLYRKFIKLKVRWMPRQSMIMFHASLFFGLSRFLAISYNYLDILMLKAMSSVTDISFYSGAYKLLNLSSIIPTILATAFLPQFSKYFSDYKKLSELFSKGAGYLLIVIFPLIPIVLLYARPIMVLYCGPDFAPSAPAFQILVLAAGAQMLNIFFVPLYAAIDAQKKVVHFQIVGLLVNIGLNLILIPKLSYIGASIATVCTEITIFAFIYRWIKKKINERIFPDFHYIGNILVSTAFVVGVILATLHANISLIPSLFIVMVIYGGALQLFHIIDWTRILRTITRMMLRKN